MLIVKSHCVNTSNCVASASCVFLCRKNVSKGVPAWCDVLCSKIQWIGYRPIWAVPPHRIETRVERSSLVLPQRNNSHLGFTNQFWSIFTASLSPSHRKPRTVRVEVEGRSSSRPVARKSDWIAIVEFNTGYDSRFRSSTGAHWCCQSTTVVKTPARVFRLGSMQRASEFVRRCSTAFCRCSAGIQVWWDWRSSSVRFTIGSPLVGFKESIMGLRFRFNHRPACPYYVSRNPRLGQDGQRLRWSPVCAHRQTDDGRYRQ